MKIFLVLTTLLIANASNASELTLGMPNTICEGTGQLTNRGAPDFQFTSKRRFYDGFAHIQTTIEVLGVKVSSSAGLVVKQNGSSLDVYDPVQRDESGFKKAGKGECDSQRCTYKTEAKGGDLLLRETIVPTATGFDVKGYQKMYGIEGTYKASFTCKPLVPRQVLPDIVVEIMKLLE